MPGTADAHSDLLMEVVHAERELGEENPFRSRWLPPLRQGGMSLQVCAIYVEHGVSADIDEWREVLRQVVAFDNAVEANRDAVVAIRSRADLDQLGDGRVGLMLAIEGLSSFGEDGWLLDVLARLGVRMASLTWNEGNAFAGGLDPGTGLTPLGERIVQRMVELGIVVDLAHASPQTFDDVLRCVGDAPMLVSHACCRAVYEHPRNMTDAQLTALAERGGLLGLMPHPLVVGPQGTIETFLAHADHAVAVMGLERVGLGGDFGQQLARALGEDFEVAPGVFADSALLDIEGPQDYPALAEALRRHGYGHDEVAALMGGNLLALLRRALPERPLG